jgi:Fe-S cluster biogenesis protein NfuA
MFLGPIHHLMWDRIRLVAERDRFVGERVVEDLGEEAAPVVEQARSESGFSWDETPLEEQVGQQPIHGFLQDKVDRVETSEAALVAAVDRAFGDRGREALGRAFARHGREFAERLKAESGVEIDDLEGVQEILETYVLEGMPCDGGVTSRIDERGDLIFSRPVGLHSFYWERTGAAPELMLELGGKWIEGLLSGLHDGFRFERRTVGTVTEDRIGTGAAEAQAPADGDGFEARVHAALEQIRPMLAMDGGGIDLVSADPEAKTVAVRLTGACHGCAGAQMTLRYGVEKALRERIPELVEMEVV